MKPPRRRPPRAGRPRGEPPADVPEVTQEPARDDAKQEADPIPEHIRRMLEAAYT